MGSGPQTRPTDAASGSVIRGQLDAALAIHVRRLEVVVRTAGVILYAGVAAFGVALIVTGSFAMGLALLVTGAVFASALAVLVRVSRVREPGRALRVVSGIIDATSPWVAMAALALTQGGAY